MQKVTSLVRSQHNQKRFRSSEKTFFTSELEISHNEPYTVTTISDASCISHWAYRKYSLRTRRTLFLVTAFPAFLPTIKPNLQKDILFAKTRMVNPPLERRTACLKILSKSSFFRNLLVFGKEYLVSLIRHSKLFSAFSTPSHQNHLTGLRTHSL